jgi:membrane protease YdiL (CAAX protease family)
MLMVTVGTFIAGRYVFRDGFAGAGWHWCRVKHYVAVIGWVALLWVVPTELDLLLGTLSWPRGIGLVQVVGWMLGLSLLTVVPGFGEEFGWRGYMLPHLAQRFSTIRALSIHGVVWWAWHLPILIGTIVMAYAAAPNVPSGLPFLGIIFSVIVVSVLPVVLHGVVIAYIWSRTQSLAVASLYHATYDGFRDGLGITIGIGPVAGGWVSILLTTLGFLLLWKGDWKSLHRRS